MTDVNINIDDDIHLNIKDKLDYFIKQKKIPNIIFHGASGSGKNHIVKDFIHKIYNGNKEFIQTYVMHVNCAHGKGIRFVREDLKFFSKTNVDLKDGEIFKTIVLLNADKLTTDAQSAIRRCIELFSQSTRFFIIVEDKYKLLKPILSRFCEIYVSEPVINNRVTNLHSHSLNVVYANTFNDYESKHNTYLKTALNKYIKLNQDDKKEDKSKLEDCMLFIVKLYDKGYSSIDIMHYVENYAKIEETKKYEYLITFYKIKREFRNEKILMLFILYFLVFRTELTLENISFI
jgi:DNA polymerase III delta prime subunit